MSSGAPSPLWAQLQGSRDAAQVAATLSGLLAARQTPGSLQQAATLVQLLRQHSGDPAVASPALLLLSRWAQRQQGGAVAADRATWDLLDEAVKLALSVVSTSGLQAAPGPAAARLLGSAAEGCSHVLRLRSAEVLGQALLAEAAASWDSAPGGPPVQPPAQDVMGGLAGLLPALEASPSAACWLLAALLAACEAAACTSLAQQQQPQLGAASQAAVDALAPLYPMMRSVASSALGGRAGAARRPDAAAPLFLQPLVSVLAAGADGTVLQLPSRASGATPGLPSAASLARAAAAALCLGGLLEGALRSAPGFAVCQALAAEAEGLLLRACQAAAAWEDAAASHGGGGELEQQASSAAVRVFRDCCSLASVQAFKGCRRPAPTIPTMRCQAATVLRSALSLEPLFRLAAAQDPPAAANRLLQGQLASAAVQHVGNLAGSLAHHASLAPLEERLWLVRQLGGAAGQAFQGYRAYTTCTSTAWLAEVNAAAVKPVLDRLFMSTVVVLSSVWAAVAAEPEASAPAAPTGAPVTASDAADPATTAGAAAVAPPALPQLAAATLGTLADLQFCRLALPAYPTILKQALAVASADASAAAALPACLPCYADLAAPCEARGGAATWVVDSVAAAKVQFLLSMLGPCAHLLPPALLLDRLAPTAFLYLLHPHLPTASAAHALLAALLPAAPAVRREQLVPFYIDRALEGYPGPTSTEALRQGLASTLSALPPGSAAGLYCLERLLARCAELEVAAQGSREAAALPPLFGLAAAMLLAVDHALFRSALALVGDFLRQRRRGSRAAVQLLDVAFDAVARTDDCLRKPALVRWYQALASELAGAGGSAGAVQAGAPAAQ